MKHRIYYCPNCDTEKLLPKGRNWCDCYDPPFSMLPHTRKEDKQINKYINGFIKSMKG